MSFNDDDDVFDVSKPSSSFSYSEPEASSKKPDFLANANIPSYLKDAISRYAEENPQFLSALYSQGRKIPESTQNFANLSETLSTVFLQSNSHTVIRAAIDILDEMTDGAVSRRARVYDFERAIQALHINLWMANEIYVHASNVERRPTVDSVEFMNYLTTFIDISSFCLQDMIDSYMTSCEYAGVQPSQEVIDNGTLPYIDSSYVSLIGFPLAKHHFLYGDVSNLRHTGQIIIEDIAKAFASIIYTGEEITDEVSVSS